MKKYPLILVLVLILALVVVGTALAVTNGQPDGDDHPYVGSLVFDFAPGTPGWRCSGALISPTVVVTAGHCTDGAVASRVWFEPDMKDVDDWPGGGGDSVEGTPNTHPDFCIGCGPGLPGFDSFDVGVVVLDEPVFIEEYAVLPSAGYVDSLAMNTEVDSVGYGVQWKQKEPGPPRGRWAWNGERYYALTSLIASNHVHSDEYIKLSANPAQGKGGTCFGDSGGPNLEGGTNIILALNSYVTNANCAGVTYSNRIDTYALDFINSFLP
jgi:hypothetical protein